MEELVKGEYSEAGNVKIFVPEGYTLRSGNNMGEEDDDQVWLQTDPPGFTDYFWVILKEDASGIRASIEMSKSINEGAEEFEPFVIGDTKWSGITYYYHELVCNVLCGEGSDACYQVTVIGHRIEQPEVQTVLASLQKK